MINKVKEVREGVWRGPKLTTNELEILKPASIINLENNHRAVCAEKIYCLRRNICFYEVPMSEIFPPSRKQLIEGVTLIESAPAQIYVHCLHGVDRTGFVIAAYRMLVQGWTIEKAYQECLDYGHHVYAYWWWKRSLTKLDKERR